MIRPDYLKMLDAESVSLWMYENVCLYQSCTKLAEAYIYMRSRSGEEFYYVLDDPDHWIWELAVQAWEAR